MTDNAERVPLTSEERIALLELKGAVVLPNRVHEDLKARQLFIEACDEMEIPRFRDELEPDDYEAILGWLEMRPDTPVYLEVVADEDDVGVEGDLFYQPVMANPRLN